MLTRALAALFRRLAGWLGVRLHVCPRLLLLVLLLMACDIAMYLHEPRHAPLVLIISEALWVYRAHGDMLSIIVSNSHFGKRRVVGDMTIFGFHVVAHIDENVKTY